MTADESTDPARGVGMARRFLRHRPGVHRDVSPRSEPVDGDPYHGGIDAVIGDCGVYENGHRLPGRIPLDMAAEAARTTSGFVWIGLKHPSAQDIAVVADEFRLPALAVEDAVKAHQRPKLDV